MCRLWLETPIEYLIRQVFHIPHGSFASRYGKLFGTFFMSFFIHACGTWTMCRWTEHPGVLPSTSQMIWSDWNFFMGQALAILIEDTIVDLWCGRGKINEKSLPGGWTRAVGHIWTALWIGWSFSRFVGGSMERGYFVDSPVQFDLWNQGQKLILAKA